MPRPKAFVRQAVLDKALDLFWIHGYEATSLEQLTEVMRLGRGSLYAEFGDKHALFLEALDRYCSLRLGEMVDVLERPGPVRDAIGGLLRGMVAQLWSDPRRRGCMLVNASTELAGEDAAVAIRAAQGFERMVSAFQATLERGKRSGELSANLDTRAAARYLAATLNSVRLLAKTSDREVAEDIVELSLRVLDLTD